MRADYKMTQTTLQGVMKGTDKLVKSKVEDILNEASGRIASGEDPQEVIDAMKLNNKIGSMFDGLEYQEKQQMFILKKLVWLNRRKFLCQFYQKTSVVTEQDKIKNFIIKIMWLYPCYHSWHS